MGSTTSELSTQHGNAEAVRSVWASYPDEAEWTPFAPDRVGASLLSERECNFRALGDKVRPHTHTDSGERCHNRIGNCTTARARPPSSRTPGSASDRLPMNGQRRLTNHHRTSVPSTVCPASHDDSPITQRREHNAPAARGDRSTVHAAKTTAPAVQTTRPPSRKHAKRCPVAMPSATPSEEARKSTSWAQSTPTHVDANARRCARRRCDAIGGGKQTVRNLHVELPRYGSTRQ